MESIAPARLHEEYLDGVRGIALLMVFSHHLSSFITGRWVWSSSPLWLHEGYLGVPLFFMLSAYTLFRSSLVRFAEDKRPVLGFFIRRASRILPFWWLNVAYRSVVAMPLLSLTRPQIILINATFIFGFFGDSRLRLVPGSWSLFCEETFYFLFPFLFVFFRRVSWVLVALVVSLAVRAAWFPFMASHGHGSGDEVTWAGPPYWYCCFFIGLLVHHLQTRSENLSRLFSVRFVPLVFDLLVAAGFICLKVLPNPLELFLIGLLFACCKNPKSLFGRLSRSRLIRIFGLCCYSIYFLEFYVLDGLRPFQGWYLRQLGLSSGAAETQFLVYFPVAAGITLLAGMASFMLIEKPGVRIGKAILKWRFLGPSENSRFQAREVALPGASALSAGIACVKDS